MSWSTLADDMTKLIKKNTAVEPISPMGDVPNASITFAKRKNIVRIADKG